MSASHNQTFRAIKRRRRESSPVSSPPTHMNLSPHMHPQHTTLSHYSSLWTETPSLEGTVSSSSSPPYNDFLLYDVLAYRAAEKLSDGSASSCAGELPPTPVVPVVPVVTLDISSPFPAVVSSHPPTKRPRRKVDPTKDTRVRKFQCGTCGAKCLRKQDLNRHQATHLNGQKPFSCGHCGVGFTRQDALHRHQKAGKCYLKRPSIPTPPSSSPSNHSPTFTAPSSSSSSDTSPSDASTAAKSPSSSPSTRPPSRRWDSPGKKFSPYPGRVALSRRLSI